MVKIRILGDRRKLLFMVSLLVTVGSWIATFNNDWHVGMTPGAISALFILLGNNVFANAIKNIGVFGAGVTNEADPRTQNNEDGDQYEDE